VFAIDGSCSRPGHTRFAHTDRIADSLAVTSHIIKTALICFDHDGSRRITLEADSFSGGTTRGRERKGAEKRKCANEKDARVQGPPNRMSMPNRNAIYFPLGCNFRQDCLICAIRAQSITDFFWSTTTPGLRQSEKGMF